MLKTVWTVRKGLREPPREKRRFGGKPIGPAPGKFILRRAHLQNRLKIARKQEGAGSLPGGKERGGRMMSTATESGVNISFEADTGRKQQTKRARAALTAVLGGVLAVALLAAVVVQSTGSSAKQDELIALAPGDMEAVEVTVPHGAKAGQVLQVVVPGRRKMLFAKIPEGLSPGSSFQVLASPPSGGARLQDATPPVPPTDPAAAPPAPEQWGQGPPITDAAPPAAAPAAAAPAGGEPVSITPQEVGSDAPALDAPPDAAAAPPPAAAPVEETPAAVEPAETPAAVEPAETPAAEEPAAEEGEEKEGSEAEMKKEDIEEASDDISKKMKAISDLEKKKYEEYSEVSRAAEKAEDAVKQSAINAANGGYQMDVKVDGPMPAGWSAARDPDGRLYYVNEKSGVTAWTLPDDAKVESEEPGGGEEEKEEEEEEVAPAEEAVEAAPQEGEEEEEEDEVKKVHREKVDIEAADWEAEQERREGYVPSVLPFGAGTIPSSFQGGYAAAPFEEASVQEATLGRAEGEMRGEEQREREQRRDERRDRREDEANAKIMTQVKGLADAVKKLANKPSAAPVVLPSSPRVIHSIRTVKVPVSYPVPSYSGVDRYPGIIPPPHLPPPAAAAVYGTYAGLSAFPGGYPNGIYPSPVAANRVYPTLLPPPAYPGDPRGYSGLPYGGVLPNHVPYPAYPYGPAPPRVLPPLPAYPYAHSGYPYAPPAYPYAHSGYPYAHSAYGAPPYAQHPPAYISFPGLHYPPSHYAPFYGRYAPLNAVMARRVGASAAVSGAISAAAASGKQHGSISIPPQHLQVSKAGIQMSGDGGGGARSSELVQLPQLPPLARISGAQHMSSMESMGDGDGQGMLLD